ncbi:hypothetical protein AGLY_010768 [Aphis glycines]|uniref:Uncharacterized protein n=1 Tax=Aphis glycines TaxID=307491 RepID=A0A6G0TEH6_APHGL|nr:hypothetical protein AGLY_010768 [Aphis glycines]
MSAISLLYVQIIFAPSCFGGRVKIPSTSDIKMSKSALTSAANIAAKLSLSLILITYKNKLSSSCGGGVTASFVLIMGTIFILISSDNVLNKFFPAAALAFSNVLTSFLAWSLADSVSRILNDINNSWVNFCLPNATAPLGNSVFVFSRDYGTTQFYHQSSCILQFTTLSNDRWVCFQASTNSNTIIHDCQPTMLTSQNHDNNNNSSSPLPYFLLLIISCFGWTLFSHLSEFGHFNARSVLRCCKIKRLLLPWIIHFTTQFRFKTSFPLKITIASYQTS